LVAGGFDEVCAAARSAAAGGLPCGAKRDDGSALRVGCVVVAGVCAVPRCCVGAALRAFGAVAGVVTGVRAFGVVAGVVA